MKISFFIYVIIYLGDNMKLANEEVTISSKKIKKDYTICVVSDIHVTKYASHKLHEKLIDKIKKENPDYILIPGDMIYSSDDLLEKNVIEKLDYIIKNLCKIAPTYLVYGNHDLKDGRKTNKKLIDKYFKNMEDKSKGRFNVINNKVINIGDINIIGVTPIFEMYYMKYRDKWISYFIDEINKIEKFNRNKLNIILTHTPEVIYMLEKHISEYPNIKNIMDSIDITITGHMHDGLIPRHWQKLGIVKGDKGICASEGETMIKGSTIRIASRCRGTHNLFNGKLIITRGLAKWPHPNPLYSSIDKLMYKDITTINIKGEK